MSYGAAQSNPLEGWGVAVLVAGLAALSAGWAYGDGIIQLILVLVGIVGIGGGFAALRAARSAS